MSSSQAIGDIFDAIPRGGCIVVARPDMEALHREAATRNAQLNGECYAVEEREYRGKDYALIRRAEAWQLAQLKELNSKYIVIHGREDRPNEEPSQEADDARWSPSDKMASSRRRRYTATY